MVHCAAYDCLMVVGNTKGISFYKFQADNQRRNQAVSTNDLRALGLRCQRPFQTSSLKAKLRSDAVPATT